MKHDLYGVLTRPVDPALETALRQRGFGWFFDLRGKIEGVSLDYDKQS